MMQTVGATEARLIEAGFNAFVGAQGPLPDELAVDLKIAFYAGARHLLTTIARAARRESVPVRLDDIERELREFADECVLRCAPCAGSA